MKPQHTQGSAAIAVIWIDWYSYHIARFRALAEHVQLAGKVSGIEMVGGAGVHGKMQFRDNDRSGLSVTTLFPEGSWNGSSKRKIAVAVWKKLNEVNPEAVLVPGYYNLPALVAAFWGRARGRRTVLMTESTEQDHQRQNWKERFKGILLRSLFDWAIAGGKPHIRYLKKLNFSPQRIARHYDVVDNTLFAERSSKARLTETRSKYGLPENYFVYVGRLAAEKNVDGLLLAFSEYVHAGGTYSLVIVGDGPDSQSLQQQAKTLNIESLVHFVGFKTTQEVIPYYAFAKYFVLPSTREPWGLVVNEAMACGLPVIVSDRCGCVEDLVQDGVNGWTFDPYQKSQLVECLQKADHLPAAKKDSFVKSSLEIIGCYSPENWANEVVRVLAA